MMNKGNFDVAHVHLKILAVDDTQMNLDLLEMVLGNGGHTVVTALSGEEAISSFQAERPDLVLMDVMMPGIGGIEATRRIRALDADRWVPIIFISALSHRDDMVVGLDAGGDDYLGKPIDIVLLMAKINAMQRIAALEGKLQESNLQLKAYRDNSERELDMARELLEHMVAGSSTPLPDVELWLQPAANLGGDLLITQQFNHEIEYVLLADAMGHGLSAAFPLVPLVQVFSAMTRTGKSVAEIVQEMNTRLSRLLPVGNFVALTLIAVDRKNRRLEIWNGGNPPTLLADSAGNVTRQFKSRNMALGIMRGDEFDATTETMQWTDECSLTLYSDGLADAVSVSGVEFGAEAIMAAIYGKNSHLSLKAAISAHLGGKGSNDDISLATVRLK
jgi:two-component system, HptB-dependent secretion and biofilm response regulator